MSGCDIRPMFTFPPKDSTLQYKNAYTSEKTFLALVPWVYPDMAEEKFIQIHVNRTNTNLLGKIVKQADRNFL